MVLDDAISDTIKRMKQEWAFTSYEVVGVLHVIAARYAHMTIIHEGDE
jgi:hypothetical protein